MINYQKGINKDHLWSVQELSTCFVFCSVTACASWSTINPPLPCCSDEITFIWDCWMWYFSVLQEQWKQLLQILWHHLNMLPHGTGGTVNEHDGDQLRLWQTPNNVLILCHLFFCTNHLMNRPVGCGLIALNQLFSTNGPCEFHSYFICKGAQEFTNKINAN